ncbi:MAG: hypothetical protein ACRERU_05910 [Methylococcales bacterium]
MKKVIALFLVLGLFASAPAMAVEDSILTGVSQSEVTALADTEMSQIQGEGDGRDDIIWNLLGGLLNIVSGLLSGLGQPR